MADVSSFNVAEIEQFPPMLVEAHEESKPALEDSKVKAKGKSTTKIAS